MNPLQAVQGAIGNPLLGGTNPYGGGNIVSGVYPADTYNPAPAPTSGGGAPSGPTAAQIAAAQSAAQYDQAIGNTQSALDRLGAQLNSGYSSLDTQATDALNQLLLGRNQGETAYKGNKQQTATNYVGAKNTIGANAGSTLNSILRLLGSRGAGGSSAYNIAAPGAVARQATLQRTDASNTDAQNNQALDTNWGNFLTGYDNQVSGVNSQKQRGRQSLEQNIDSNRASLLQTLAQLSGQRAAAAGGSATGAAQPYFDQANSVLDRTANYSIAPITYQTQAYQAPSLSSYNVNPNAAPTYQGQGASNDYVSPYLQSLLGKKQLSPA